MEEQPTLGTIRPLMSMAVRCQLLQTDDEGFWYYYEFVMWMMTVDLDVTQDELNSLPDEIVVKKEVLAAAQMLSVYYDQGKRPN